MMLNLSTSRLENSTWGGSLLTEQTQQYRDGHFNDLRKHLTSDQH